MSTGEHRLALPAGYELGKYRFVEVLGSGGFGITYLAEDSTLKRRVAIKELLPNELATRVDGTTVAAKTRGDEENLAWARERFVNEGRALAACEHQNVVDVYEMVEANGTAYMVTKYEEGRSLEQWLRELGRAPNEAELRGILLPLLSGLEKVHATGFLHRDIKPENIYLTNDGRPMLLDFGSARQAISNRSMAMTSIVTSGYAPFEQYYEDGNQGPWSDIYALGAVMFRAIKGKKPPEAMRRLKDDPCEKLAARHDSGYSAEFLKAVDKALAVNESRRPQSVAEWRAMLGSEPPASATTLARETVRPRAGIFERMQERPWLGAAAIIAAVVCMAGTWELFKPKPKPVIAKGKTVAVSPTPAASSRPSASRAAIAQNSTPAPEPSAPDDNTPPANAPDNQPSASATPAVPPGGQETAVVDSRLVGSWQTGATRSKRVRWDLWADGRWVVSGPENDAGTLSVADGRIRQFSNNTQQWTDIAYEFDNETLVTHSAIGTKNWRRIGGTSDASDGNEKPASGEKRKSASSEREKSPTRTRTHQIPDGRDIMRHIMRHF